MGKNILFIILFVALYGGLFLLAGHKDGDTLTDRNGYGELTDTYYDCERFSIKMEFEPQWLVFDGVSMENAFLDAYSEGEFKSIYGSDMENFAFIAGAAAPEAEFFCMGYPNYNLPETKFNESMLRSDIEDIKNSVLKKGGTMGRISCRTISPQGGSNKMMVYYYDYELQDEYFSTFVCYANSGRDTIFIKGEYLDAQGLLKLNNFVQNNFYLYSDSDSNI